MTLRIPCNTVIDVVDAIVLRPLSVWQKRRAENEVLLEVVTVLSNALLFVFFPSSVISLSPVVCCVTKCPL